MRPRLSRRVCSSARQGYTGISTLERDANGRWSGTAQKNGKTVFVGVVLPQPAAEAITN